MVHRAFAQTLLMMWERAYGLSLVQKGLTLLSLAMPEASISQLANLTIGERDAALLDLRASLYGPQIESIAGCPQCSTQLQISFSTGDIRLEASSSPSPLTTHIEGRSVTIRPLTSADLLAVGFESSAHLRRQALLNRSVTVITDDSSEKTPAQLANWGETAQKAIAHLLATIDPQADIRIALDCSSCHHKWSSRFDIASHLWAEVDVFAQRLMAEVHALAFAYGWTERDILSMTPWRRQLYMGMLRR